MSSFKAYYLLTKPGIVYGNTLMAVAGYLFGSDGSPHTLTFFALLFGISFVIGAACMYNNVLDEDIDRQMERTKQRAIVTGAVKRGHALSFATILFMLGLSLLFLGTNLLTSSIAYIGLVAYVILYGLAKRRTIHSTLVGTFSGSTPPVIGYTAATNTLDQSALLLFLLLAAWQMAHFYSIAIVRRDDYKRANVPVWSVVKGPESTQRQVIFYVLVFITLCVLIGIYGNASLLWLLIMMAASGYWLYVCLQKFEDMTAHARKQFHASLYVLLALSVTLSVDSFWP